MHQQNQHSRNVPEGQEWNEYENEIMQYEIKHTKTLFFTKHIPIVKIKRHFTAFWKIGTNFATLILPFQQKPSKNFILKQLVCPVKNGGSRQESHYSVNVCGSWSVSRDKLALIPPPIFHHLILFTTIDLKMGSCSVKTTKMVFKSVICKFVSPCVSTLLVWRRCQKFQAQFLKTSEIALQIIICNQLSCNEYWKLIWLK